MNIHQPSNCRICGIASGKYPLGEVDRPWLQDDRYMAFTSVGALVEGWSLVTPRAHSLNLLESYCEAAFASFVRKAITAVEGVYGSVAIFEHGGQHEGSETNCGTAHAHLHIVPVDFSLQQAAVRFDPDLAWFRCSPKDVKSRVGANEYLFMTDRYSGVETAGDVCILEKGRSQFFRRVIADRLGRLGEWNYSTHPNLLTAEAGSDALRRLSDQSRAA